MGKSTGSQGMPIEERVFGLKPVFWRNFRELRDSYGVALEQVATSHDPDFAKSPVLCTEPVKTR